LTHLTDDPVERRSGPDRRRAADGLIDPARPVSPIADWPLVVPAHLRDVRSSDPWARVVHEAIVDTVGGRHVDAALAWEPSIEWRLAGLDPTAGVARGGHVARPDHPPGPTHVATAGVNALAAAVGRPGVGPAAVRAYHRELVRLTGGTFRQELVSIESGRGPIVEAHVQTTAARPDRVLDIPTLVMFELRSLRIRLVTEFPGDVAAWEAFWRA
jgi:ketosteroid isomerase-like protein